MPWAAHLTRFLQTMVFDVKATDRITFYRNLRVAGSSGVGCVFCSGTEGHAVDPLVALRHQ